MKTVRVLIVDDLERHRELLKNLIAHIPEVELLGEAADGRAGVARALELKPDLVLMDVDMPGFDGPAATRELLDLQPGLPVLAMSVSGSADDRARMTRAGAAGYLTKGSGPEELREAILAAARRTDRS